MQSPKTCEKETCRLVPKERALYHAKSKFFSHPSHRSFIFVFRLFSSFHCQCTALQRQQLTGLLYSRSPQLYRTQLPKRYYSRRYCRCLRTESQLFRKNLQKCSRKNAAGISSELSHAESNGTAQTHSAFHSRCQQCGWVCQPPALLQSLSKYLRHSAERLAESKSNFLTRPTFRLVRRWL